MLVFSWRKHFFLTRRGKKGVDSFFNADQELFSFFFALIELPYNIIIITIMLLLLNTIFNFDFL
jgi:hypothetical protein